MYNYGKILERQTREHERQKLIKREQLVLRGLQSGINHGNYDKYILKYKINELFMGEWILERAIALMGDV